MSSRVLKIIAIVTMTVDHIGLYLLPYGDFWYYVCRSVGRIAFPLFAFFIAEGFYHSHDVGKYLLRLFLFAAAVEIFLAIYGAIAHIDLLFTANVFWVLVFGLVSLIMLARKEWYLRLLVLPILVGAELLKVPYGAYGVAMILIFGYYRQFPLQVLFVFILNLLFIDYPLLKLIGAEMIAKYPWIQWFSVLALVPIYLYNGSLGRGSKWFFYVYYPLHLGVIFTIGFFISR